MPKGIKTPLALKQSVIKDYYELMPIKQISIKYGINRRRIYDWIEKSNRLGYLHPNLNRKMAYLSRDEIEVMLLMIIETENILTERYRLVAKSLETRLLDMADELEEMARITQNNVEKQHG